MNIFEKFLYFLQNTTMTRPTSYGWFHLLCMSITIFLIIYYVIKRKKLNEKSLKRLLIVYGVGAFILELLKQIVWAFNCDPTLNLVTWNYEWYAAPFQLCSTPIYVSLICIFLKKNKVRDALLSYIAFITILGSLTTFFYPNDVFVGMTLINIHTMYLHCGSLVLSFYLLLSKEVAINKKSFFSSYIVFIIFAAIAELLNLTIYNSGILAGQTFNMFYISPYFISSLPVFNVIQENVPFILFLFLYLLAIFLGSLIIFGVAKLISNIKGRR